MEKKTSYSSLLKFDKILLYGAGDLGTRFLQTLFFFGYDKSKIIVWDICYNEIKTRLGLKIGKPDFDNCNNDKNIIVIITLNIEDKISLINKIKQQFSTAGYNNIITANDVSFAERLACDQFENKAYADCAYQSDIDFSKFTSFVKPIAYYLPQFHEIPENNMWWGKGFSEWSNTSITKPKFKGHYQPREPHDDFGYYDLSDIEVIRKQAELAKRHGIYGWCIYYYWFSGRKLLSTPLDLLLDNKNIDIHFCLLWCNDSWTKSWVGKKREELIKCEYREDDPEKFIDDFKKYTDDERYIRINGNPLIIIYLIQNIPNIRDVVRRWRKRAVEIGIGKITVFSSMQPFSIYDYGLQDCFDGEMHFSPVRYTVNTFQLIDSYNRDISSFMSRYADCLSNYIRIVNASNHKAYLSCVSGWDNTPRYNNQCVIHDLGFLKKLFYEMVRYITDEAIMYNKEFIFIFAWNEWAEGAYIEPDKKFGYTLINTFSKALFGLPL